MDLREYLLTMNQAGDSWSKAGDLATQLRQMDAKQKLVQDLPQLMANKDIAGLAGQSMMAGDQKLMDYAGQALAQNMLPKAKPGSARMTREQIKLKLPDGTPDDVIDSIYNTQDGTQQQSMVDAQFKRKGVEQKDKTIALTEKAEVRRTEQVPMNQAKDFSKSFTDQEKEIQKEELAIKNASKQLDLGKAAGDSSVINFIVRHIGGEKGPLSDSDRAAFMARMIGGDYQRALNFVTNQDESYLTDPQRETFRAIIKKAAQTFDEYKGRRLGTILSASHGAQRKLYSKDDVPDRVLTEAATRNDFEYQGNGKWVRKVKTTEHTGDMASLVTTAGKIQDPTKRMQAQRALEIYKAKGKPVPADVVKQIEMDAKEGGGN